MSSSLFAALAANSDDDGGENANRNGNHVTDFSAVAYAKPIPVILSVGAPFGGAWSLEVTKGESGVQRCDRGSLSFSTRSRSDGLPFKIETPPKKAHFSRNGYRGFLMFGFSLGHLFIVLVVVLLFNARRLPELGSALGRGMHAFKKGLDGKDGDDTPALPLSDDHHDKKDA